MYKHKLYIRASGGCIGRREGGLGEEWCWEERAAREEGGGVGEERGSGRRGIGEGRRQEKATGEEWKEGPIGHICKGI